MWTKSIGLLGCLGGILTTLTPTAAAADTPGTPIGCMIMEDTAQMTTAHCRMTEPMAREICCGHGLPYYAIGGRWPDSPMKTHHNAVYCMYSLPTDHFVDPDLCNIGCPGDDYSFSIAQWGECGGACKDCDPSWPCEGDTNVKCGIYRSVYACDESVAPVPPPEGGWTDGLGGDGGDTGDNNGGDGGDNGDNNGGDTGDNGDNNGGDGGDNGDNNGGDTGGDGGHTGDESGGDDGTGAPEGPTTDGSHPGTGGEEDAPEGTESHTPEGGGALGVKQVSAEAAVVGLMALAVFWM